MSLPPDYEALLAAPPESQLVAILAPDSAAPGVTEALELAEQASLRVVNASEGVDESGETTWELEVEQAVEGSLEPAIARVWLERAPLALLETGPFWRGLGAEDVEAARRSSWAIGASACFSGQALRCYHAQVRLLAALALEAVVVLDVNAVTPRPGHWLREVAASRTPPTPNSLFTIHDVAESESGTHWLHTHGLERSGCIELDVLDVPGSRTGLVAQLVNAAAALLLEQGVPAPAERFSAGQDLELVWLPWQEGLEHVRGGPGTESDRDDAHGGPRGILFAPKRGWRGVRYESPAVYAPILEKNPLLYVSSFESERMALLASERLPRFLRLLERYGGEPRWVFLVKLGYSVDGASSAPEREHLWFEVHGHERGSVDATLLNQPYAIARLSEGMRGKHSLELLSDWTILCDKGRFDADHVGDLERMLARDATMH